MKKMMFLVLLFAIGFSSFAAEISVIKKDLQLKVAEIVVTTQCVENSDLDPDTDASFDCKVGAIRSDIQKQFKNVSQIQAMNNNSSYVLTNQVDDEGTYSIKLRVLYY